MVRKPNVPETELEKAERQFEAHDQQIKSLTMDRMNETPKMEVEPQTRLSQNQIEKTNQLYLKPKRTVSSKEKFNEKFREDYNFNKEYVNFIAEHKEVIGDTIEMWTKPYPGVPAEEWSIPTNKPVWAPRYVAEQLKRKYYHRLKTEDRPITTDHAGQYYGQMVVDTTISRLDAYPVSNRKSIFMGATNF